VRGISPPQESGSRSSAPPSIMMTEFPIPAAWEICWWRGRGLLRFGRSGPRVRVETSAPPVSERKRSLG